MNKHFKMRNAGFATTMIVAVMIQTAHATLTDSLANLNAGGTLSIDNKTFSGFSYFASGSPLPSFDPSLIDVTVSESDGVDYLTWSGNISLTASGIAAADLKLNYIVTANPEAIGIIGQSYVGSAPNGFLAIDETVATATFGGPVVAFSHLQVGDFSDPPAEAIQGDNLIINPSQNILYVTKDIGLAISSVNGGTDTISLVQQSFIVPEPTTVIAGALLILPFGLHGLRRLFWCVQV